MDSKLAVMSLEDKPTASHAIVPQPEPLEIEHGIPQ